MRPGLCLVIGLSLVASAAEARPKGRVVTRLVKRAARPIVKARQKLRTARIDRAQFKRLLAAKPRLKSEYKAAKRKHNVSKLDLAWASLFPALMSTNTYLFSKVAMDAADKSPIIAGISAFLGVAHAVLAGGTAALMVRDARRSRARARLDTLRTAKGMGVELTKRQQAQVTAHDAAENARLMRALQPRVPRTL